MKIAISQLKYFKSLHLQKNRQNYHNFIVEGTKMAGEVLANGGWAVEAIVALPAWLDANAAKLQHLDAEILQASPGELERISLLQSPNQVFMVVKKPDWVFDSASLSQGLTLYLDDIRDPGNLGTILRIADWFGVKWVLCSPDSVEVFSPKVVQASMGAFLRVKSVEIGFEQLLTDAIQVPVVGTVLDGEPVFQANLPNPAIIAIGNESKGLSPKIQSTLSNRISIPKGRGGGAESLNAAVATGIVCAAFGWQHGG